MIAPIVAVLGLVIGPTGFSALVWGAILIVVLVFVFVLGALILDAKRT